MLIELLAKNKKVRVKLWLKSLGLKLSFVLHVSYLAKKQYITP